MFEKFTNVTVPNSATVKRDVYQDMSQDYIKILELKLDEKSKTELLFSIAKSKFFDPAVYSDTSFDEKQMIHVDDRQGLWYRTKSGYSFIGWTNNRRDNVNGVVDTIAKTVKFEYSAD